MTGSPSFLLSKMDKIRSQFCNTAGPLAQTWHLWELPQSKALVTLGWHGTWLQSNFLPWTTQRWFQPHLCDLVTSSNSKGEFSHRHLTSITSRERCMGHALHTTQNWNLSFEAVNKDPEDENFSWESMDTSKIKRIQEVQVRNCT